MHIYNEHLRFAVMLEERVSALQGEVVLTCCLLAGCKYCIRLHVTGRHR